MRAVLLLEPGRVHGLVGVPRVHALHVLVAHEGERRGDGEGEQQEEEEEQEDGGKGAGAARGKHH